MHPLLEEILLRWGLKAPDGRTLFSYRIDEADLENLARVLRQMLPGIEAGMRYVDFEPLFCLYAAETFRRELVDGHWTWVTVMNPLGLNNNYPPPLIRQSWVEAGLDWWRRPILHSPNGARLFLVTIACEGGLPLGLLTGINSLSNYFKELLDTYHQAGCRGEEDACARAQQLAYRLPPRHRHDVVYQLSGRLVSAVVALRHIIGDVPEPIAALTENVPNWRLRLPLNADDQTVDALLAPLIKRLPSMAPLKWQGFLRQTSPEIWKLEKVLDVPETVQGTAIRQWLNRPQDQALPGRLRLLLNTEGESEVVAWLTRGRGVGDEVVFRREWLRRDGLRLAAGDLLSSQAIELHDGQQLTPVPSVGAESWAGALPWIFVEKSGSLVWQGQGSARTRAETAWVVVPESLTPVEDAGGDCPCVGKVVGIDRLVYQVSTEATFTSPEGETFKVICHSPDDTDQWFGVSGETLPGLMGTRPVYRGLPFVAIEDPDGRLRALQNLPGWHREWRLVNHPGTWRKDSQGLGFLWLRLVDDQGCERFRRQVAVVPRGLRVERNCGAPGTGGNYRLSGLHGGQVVVRSSGVGGIQITRNGPEELTVLCPTQTGTSLPLLTFEIRWNNGQPITIDLPYPQRGAVFLMSGRPLADNTTVPVARCGGLRLVVLEPAGEGRFDLEGERGVRFLFRSRLPPLQDGRIDVSLHPWQDQLTTLLANQLDLDAGILLSVKRLGGTLARLFVKNFDATLSPGPLRDRVSVLTTAPDLLDVTRQDRLTLSMFPLWDPTRAPRPLELCTDAPLSWLIPENIEAGPWWVIGRDQDWARFRPLLWTVPAADGERPVVVSDLECAIREPDQDRRQDYLSEVLTALGTEPDHPDWPLFFSFIDLTREFPPNALDVLRELPKHPPTLMMALLRADEDSFEWIWSLTDGLPFLWWLLPVTDWLGTSLEYLGMVQEALSEIDHDGELLFSVFDNFRNRIQTQHPAFAYLCDWLQEHLYVHLVEQHKPWENLSANSKLIELRKAPLGISGLVNQSEMEMQARRQQGEKWPIANSILDRAKNMAYPPQFQFNDLGPIHRSVRCAPFVAADLAINGGNIDDGLVLDLRLHRAFDQLWFDNVYGLALAWGLAQLPPSR